MTQGRHLLIDCRGVSSSVCEDDALVLDVLARAARRAGSTVISQVRYRFGHNSPPGFAVMVMLDESHCSAHCYSEGGQIAMDVFTCGSTDPKTVFQYIQEELDLGTVVVQEVARFVDEPVREADPPAMVAQPGA